MLSVKFLAGVAVGAAAMAMLDPNVGRSRRARLADQSKAKARRVRETAQRKAQYEAGRQAGEEATRLGAGTFDPADDISLADHLHGRMSRLDIPTDHLNIEVVDGVVRIRGQIDTPDDIDRIVETVIGEPGVRDVESYLHLPGEPAPNKEEALAASARAARAWVMR